MRKEGRVPPPHHRHNPAVVTYKGNTVNHKALHLRSLIFGRDHQKGQTHAVHDNNNVSRKLLREDDSGIPICFWRRYARKEIRKHESHHAPFRLHFIRVFMFAYIFERLQNCWQMFRYWRQKNVSTIPMYLYFQAQGEGSAADL